MRAAVLKELGRIEVIDTSMPQITEETQVQVRVRAVGICGTDLHMFREPRKDVTLPRIMGHELSGEVTAVGTGVTSFKTGDRVVLDPVFACGECPTCRKGYHNVCEKVRCYGVQMDGGFQDYIVVDEKHLSRFSEQISFEQAALAEPFSIASNMLDRAGLRESENVLIFGCGTIGLAVLTVAKSLGARIMVTDVVSKKLELAAGMGAAKAVNRKEQDLDDAAAAFAPGGFDVVIDAVGITTVFEKAVLYAAPRGRIVCIGFSDEPARLAPGTITRKELTIVGSRMNCHRFPIVMDWLNRGKISADAMISKVFPVERIQEAFEATLADPASVKTIITF